MDVTRRSADKWIIDFGWTMSEADAALYEAPFRHVLMFVKPVRDLNARNSYRINWWRHVEPRQGLFRAATGLHRLLCTPEVSKYRVFVWLDPAIMPDHKLQVITRDDDVTFGILHSAFHRIWAAAVGSWHGVGNDLRYTISTTFETFPFPDGLTPNIPAADYISDRRAQAIAAAARRLNELREAWLNPTDLVVRTPEVVPGYPDRLLPKDDEAAKALKKRTLTNLYNLRPTWLDTAHRDLDAAVAASYGWPADLSDEQVLERLFALNQERSAAGR
jgi:type II restriction/modification system DNA methylase subunit YeeA